MSAPKSDADGEDEEFREELDRRADEVFEDDQLVTFAEHNERRDD